MSVCIGGATHTWSAWAKPTTGAWAGFTIARCSQCSQIKGA